MSQKASLVLLNIILCTRRHHQGCFFKMMMNHVCVCLFGWVCVCAISLLLCCRLMLSGVYERIEADSLDMLPSILSSTACLPSVCVYVCVHPQPILTMNLIRNECFTDPHWRKSFLERQLYQSSFFSNFLQFTLLSS